MIHVDVGATMECVEPKCGEKLGIKLALSVMGGFLPRIPQGHGWQISTSENGAFVCRCPKHHAVIQQLPQAGRIVPGAPH